MTKPQFRGVECWGSRREVRFASSKRRRLVLTLETGLASSPSWWSMCAAGLHRQQEEATYDRGRSVVSKNDRKMTGGGMETIGSSSPMEVHHESSRYLHPTLTRRREVNVDRTHRMRKSFYPDAVDLATDPQHDQHHAQARQNNGEGCRRAR